MIIYYASIMQVATPMESAAQATQRRNTLRIAAFKGTETRQYFISVEQSVLCEHLISSQLSICGLPHFVFNLEYDKNAKHVSLFFQDVILGLPDTNKRGASYIAVVSDLKARIK